MTFKNSPTQYGNVSKCLHWAIAALVILQLAVGSWMGGLPRGDFKLDVVLTHKSCGILILFLMILRLLWHLFSHRPAPAESLTKWERIGSRALHDSFYVLLIVMPLTGWAMSSAAGAPVHVFGLFTLPNFVAQDKAAAHLFRATHGIIGNILIAVVCAHVAAALLHHFYKKNTVLKRMLPLLFGLALLGGYQLPAHAAAQAAEPKIAAQAAEPKAAIQAAKHKVAAENTSPGAQKWTLLHQKSTITFTPTQLGKSFTGYFGVFAADILFSPNDLAASRVLIDVHMNTAETGAPDRNQNLLGDEWFDAAKFPDAFFKSTAFHKTGKDTYSADGVLTIKGISLPVTLPFKLDIAPGPQGLSTATADGMVTLDRHSFNIGIGQWKSSDIIASMVPVRFHIVALSATPHN